MIAYPEPLEPDAIRARIIALLGGAPAHDSGDELSDVQLHRWRPHEIASALGISVGAERPSKQPLEAGPNRVNLLYVRLLAVSRTLQARKVISWIRGLKNSTRAV